MILPLFKKANSDSFKRAENRDKMQNCTLFLYEILNYNRLTLESQSSEKYMGGEMKRNISLKGNNNAKNNKKYEEV